MKINNKYIIWWDSVTKVIQNDHTKEVPDNTSYDFAAGIEFYGADSISDITAKISSLGLKPKTSAEDESVTTTTESALQSKLGDWQYPERGIRAALTYDSIVALAKDFPELLVRIKQDNVPTNTTDGVAVIYLITLEPAHRQLLLNYGAVIENK